jgi:hypothetical protein
LAYFLSDQKHPGLAVRDPLRVSIFTHQGKWIVANVVRYSLDAPHGTLCIEAQAPFEGGTSGGPVIDSSGRLIGIISQRTRMMKNVAAC